MTTQKFERLYEYIHEFQSLIYDYYSKDVVAFLTTYYHIDKEETIWEDENMFGGAYEKIGDLSGVRWNKYLLIPVYYSEEISTSFDGQDIGYVKENETSFVIPSTYGFTPFPNDKFKLEQHYLRPTNDVYPVFSVTGVEKSVNADRLFWKLKVEVEQSITTTQLDLQVADTYSFYDYDKKIHTIEHAEFLTRLLSKNKTLRDRLRHTMYDKNSGYYFINNVVEPC